MMATRPNEFEQFMLLFNDLKRIAEMPQRPVTFHDAHAGLQDAVRKLQSWLLRTDFERRKFAGQKLFQQVPAHFDELWTEFQQLWAPALAHLQMRDVWPEVFGDFDPAKRGKTWAETEPENPDPEIDSNFDPLHHNGGTSLSLGIDLIQTELQAREEKLKIGYGSEDDERIANMCRIALGAYDYLTKTVGIDPDSVLRRWRILPPFFMPAVVSNAHGDEQGSLNDLLNDAIRAFVTGAPTAAIALCRSCVEILLKKHYLANDHKRETRKGKPADKPLKDLIILAERRYAVWNRAKMAPRLARANDILHNYSRVGRLDPKDDKIILDYLVTLRTLIAAAPS
jgi:hypothetical protein